MKLSFSQWLAEGNSTIAVVYHGTGAVAMKHIMDSGRLRASQGQYGTAVYTTLENIFQNHRSYEYVISAAVDLNGFAIFTSTGELRKHIYGTEYKAEMIPMLFPSLSLEERKDLLWGWSNTKWLDYLEKNTPGIVFEGRGASTWVVVYDEARLRLHQYAKTSDMVWKSVK